MAGNAAVLRRPTDKNLYIGFAAFFPLIVLVGYFKSYYFASFFEDARPIANALVHAHGIVMSVWVLFFAAQIALIRTKNIKLHITFGLIGIILATLVVIVGLLTAYDSQIVRQTAPPGLDPHEFFIIPVGDILLFVIFFAGAIYYRKRPLEHKSLMLMTAINFMPPAFMRMPIFPPDYALLIVFLICTFLTVSCLIWLKVKRGKFSRIFAVAALLFILGLPLRLIFAKTFVWHSFTNWLAS